MDQPEAQAGRDMVERVSALTVFQAFLKLGLTSFGGPIAHLGYFREEFVMRRQWLDDRAYADLVALSQFTPGPASSKVGMGIGLSAAGIPGALAAWLAFTAPSAIALVVFAYGVGAYAQNLDAGWLHGLKVAAVAVVAQAVWGMAKNLCPDAPRFTLAAVASIIAVLWPSSLGQSAAIALGAGVGCAFLRGKTDDGYAGMRVSLGKTAGAASLVLFFGLLIALP